jgi:hypothetical protein
MHPHLYALPTVDMFPAPSVRPAPVLTATETGFEWTWGEPDDPPKWVLERADGEGGWIREAEEPGTARDYTFPPFTDPGEFRLVGSDELGNVFVTGYSNLEAWP